MLKIKMQNGVARQKSLMGTRGGVLDKGAGCKSLPEQVWEEENDFILFAQTPN